MRGFDAGFGVPPATSSLLSSLCSGEGIGGVGAAALAAAAAAFAAAGCRYRGAAASRSTAGSVCTCVGCTAWYTPTGRYGRCSYAAVSQGRTLGGYVCVVAGADGAAGVLAAVGHTYASISSKRSSSSSGAGGTRVSGRN